MNTAPFEKITREEYNETVADLVNNAKTVSKGETVTIATLSDYSYAVIANEEITLYTATGKIIGTLYIDRPLVYDIWQQ